MIIYICLKLPHLVFSSSEDVLTLMFVTSRLVPELFLTSLCLFFGATPIGEVKRCHSVRNLHGRGRRCHTPTVQAGWVILSRRRDVREGKHRLQGGANSGVSGRGGRFEELHVVRAGWRPQRGNRTAGIPNDVRKLIRARRWVESR